MHSSQIQAKLIKGDNNFVAFEVPKSQPFDVYRIAISDGIQWSNLISVNNPRAMHFDKPEIASGDTFRIFGRNLYVAPGSPTVVEGLSSPPPVNLSKSDAYSLTVTAPAGLVAGRTYQVLVSNGFGSAYADICILGHAINGSDYFNLGVAWGSDFLVQNGRITLESSITRTTMSSTSPAIPLSLPMPRATGLTMTGHRSRRPST